MVSGCKESTWMVSFSCIPLMVCIILVTTKSCFIPGNHGMAGSSSCRMGRLLIVGWIVAYGVERSVSSRPPIKSEPTGGVPFGVILGNPVTVPPSPPPPTRNRTTHPCPHPVHGNWGIHPNRIPAYINMGNRQSIPAFPIVRLWVIFSMNTVIASRRTPVPS